MEREEALKHVWGELGGIGGGRGLGDTKKKRDYTFYEEKFKKVVY